MATRTAGTKMAPPPPDLLEALQAQIALEEYANRCHTQLANWADSQSFEGLQTWAGRRAKARRKAAYHWIQYLRDRATVELRAIPAPQAAYDGYAAALLGALNSEQAVSAGLAQIGALAAAAGDGATAFLARKRIYSQVAVEKEIAGYLKRLARGAPVDLLDLSFFE